MKLGQNERKRRGIGEEKERKRRIEIDDIR
jgi:hypothetical protein